jgi:hypothetical protein
MIVNLTPTEEQQLVEDSIRGLLADKLPVDRLRESHSHGGAAERAVVQKHLHLVALCCT